MYNRFPKLVNFRIANDPPMVLIERCVSRVETVRIETTTPHVWKKHASWFPKLRKLHLFFPEDPEKDVDIKDVQLMIDSFPQVQQRFLLLSKDTIVSSTIHIEIFYDSIHLQSGQVGENRIYESVNGINLANSRFPLTSTQETVST